MKRFNNQMRLSLAPPLFISSTNTASSPPLQQMSNHQCYNIVYYTSLSMILVVIFQMNLWKQYLYPAVVKDWIISDGSELEIKYFRADSPRINEPVKQTRQR
jgi:hypothetical protein